MLVDRYPFTFGPTPIEKLFRLSEHLGGQVEVYAKREGCNSGLAFGGNKLRKPEYIVPDALGSNADTLVTSGGVQSTCIRQVAAVAPTASAEACPCASAHASHYG